MTTDAPARPSAVGLGPAPPRREPLDPAWPLTLLTVGMPLCYFAGVAWLAWIIPGVVFGIDLARARRVSVPAAALPLIALSGWALITGIRLPGLGALPLFGYRWMVWVAAVASLVWLVNPVSRRTSSRRVVSLLAALWIVLIAFGYLAMLFPNFEAASLLQLLLPTRLAQQPFIYDITVIRFAELQTFTAGAVSRPAAPMAYTNGWGSTIGLLTPFFISSWIVNAGGARRIVGSVLGLAAVIPIIVSTNRGLWLSLAATLVYLGIRRARDGDARVLVTIGFVTAFAIILALMTPLNDSIQSRFSGANDSNTTRERLYDTALTGTELSPLLGYGAPVSTDTGPAIGTHGLVWYVMFAHGFPALGLLVIATMALLIATARARTEMALWAHLAIVAFAVQIPFYGLFPQIVLVGVAAGVAIRENRSVTIR